MRAARILIGVSILAGAAAAEETIVKHGSLPFATLSQEITYSTTQKDYLAHRDKVLEELKKGNYSAAQNTADAPWMRVETTATVGLEFKGVGTADGKKLIRQVSASEEAWVLFKEWEKEQKKG